MPVEVATRLLTASRDAIAAAARADSEAAVAEVFRAKGRPDFNPLIVHVASHAMARELARFDERAEALAARYWPGPLTLVLPALDSAVAPAVTAGTTPLPRTAGNTRVSGPGQ